MKDSVITFTQKLEAEFEDLQPGTLTPQSDLRNSLDWSSINALLVMAFITSEYELKLKVEELQKCITVQSLYDMVSTKNIND